MMSLPEQGFGLTLTLGTKAIKEAFDRYSDPSRQDEALLELLK